MGYIEHEHTLHLYPSELTGIDIVGDNGYVRRVLRVFGDRHMNGTGVLYTPTDSKITYNMEPFLRHLFNQIRPRRAIEIGTLYGITTALLAHYSEEVVTIDLYYQQVAAYVRHHFGVAKKVRAIIVRNDADKKELLDNIDFDFAFIDAEHTYEAVKFDFECVKKCGLVLFHDYDLPNHTGVTKFIDELPKKELSFHLPFALWQKQ